MVGFCMLAGIGAWRSGLGAAPADPGGQWCQPERRSLDQTLLLKGSVLPMSAVNLAAPADGRLAERPVQIGDFVATGQLVARIDSPDLLAQLREAEVAAIRADQELQAARGIEQGAEYQAAQRRAVQAEGALSASRRRAVETQALYDRGIVARAELEGVQQDVQSAQAQVQSAREEVASLLKKRSPEALRLLQIEAQGRHERLTDLRARERALRITAPISGVVLAPMIDGDPAAGSGAPREFRVGSAISTRDVLFTVGDTSAFIVKAWVDEQDVGRLEAGLHAAVMLNSDPSRELSGEVLRISSQARTLESRRAPAPAEFELQVLVRPPVGQTLRLGSMARLRITPKPAPAGLSVPLAALRWGEDGKPLLRVRDPAGAVALRPVEVIRTSVDAVEVRSGLAERDEVWVPGGGEAASSSRGEAVKRLLGAGE